MSLRRKIFIGAIAVLLAAPLAALYFLASTEAGLRFIVSHLGGGGPVTVEVQNVGGTLVDGFTADVVHVHQRRVDVRVEGVAGRIQLLPLLLQRRIAVPSLDVRAVTVQLFRVPDDTPHEAPRFLPATLSIDAGSLRLGSIDLVLMSGHDLHASNAAGAVRMNSKQIRLRHMALDWEDMHLATEDSRVLAADPVGLKGDLSSDWHQPGQPVWRFDTRFDGDLDKLPLTLDVSKPFHAHLEGAATTLNSGWKLAGNVATKDLDITVFGAGNTLGILSAQLAVEVDDSGFAARGPVTAPGLQAGPIQLDFHGSYANRRLTIRDTKLVHEPSGTHVAVRGTVDSVPNGPRLGLSGEWTTLQWPLVAKGEPAFTSTSGRFSLDGLKPWKVRASGIIAAAGYTNMPATLTGVLGNEALTIDAASLGVLGGTATVSGGEARWHPAESWQVRGHMSGFDPAQIRADLPGRLDFDFRAGGAPFGNGSIDFALSQLTGKLRGQAASGSGEFMRPAGSLDWQFHQVDLQLGQAHLQLDGALGDTPDVKFALDADDLSLFDPSARGRLSARGRFAGTKAAPLLLFKARGSDFEWQGYRVGELDADLDIDLKDDGHARGLANLTDIRHDARTVHKATLNLAGTGKNQRVTLDVDAAPLRTALMAEGAMDNGLWRGTVQSLTVGDGANLALRLVAPAPLALNLSQVELGKLCLAGEQARGCGSARLAPDGHWNTAFDAESMPLLAFTAGLTQDVDYDGTIDLDGELAGSPGTLPTGSVHGQLKDAQLRHTLSNGRVERLPLGTGSVSAEAGSTAFNVQVALDAGEAGAIKGKLTGERDAAAWQDYPIRGELDARTNALSVLDIYVGGIDKATGEFGTRVDISGTLGSPVIAGSMQLRNTSIDVYQVNLALRDLSLDAHFDNNALDITGQSRLGDGIAHFNGKLSWRDSQPYGNLHMEGDRLLVVNIPEARIEASPKLDFKLDGRRIEASGEVLIPKAKLEPADLTSAVLASSDEVLVGAPVEDADGRWTVVSDIRLVLGSDVNIDSLGLTAKLGGSLEVRTDESQTSRGQGELNIESGKYMAFGRLLDIERGKLLFQNVPLGDPGVDLRAQKEFTDVTAGVNVRGPLRAPRLTFYSEPSLPQSQIASLILAGGSLESVQNTDQPGAARNEMLAQGGAILAQRVGSHVGIDDVGIESAYSADSSGGNDTSLVLGKYLSPRLYISYGISLAEAINTLKLRYTIGDHWMIKTEAGKARSADIVYTLKRK